MRRILVLGTGGTISCAETDGGRVPSLSVSELAESVKLPVELCAEQLFNIDSTNMTPRHWEQLARRIRNRYDEFDGFVILHGTDTMAYAAASLSCLIQNPSKPIVLTGSMKPMTAENSDAPQNLRDAVTFAADERAFGVRVVFGRWIYHGWDVFKQNSDLLEPFESVSETERFSQSGALQFDKEYRGEIRFYERLSDDIFHVKLIPGQSLCVPKNTKALILESYGLGGVPDYLLRDVKALAENGVYIIIATQCSYGGTDIGCYAVGHVDFPLLETKRMTVEYAVAKARLALAYSSGYDEFKRIFTQEVNEL